MTTLSIKIEADLKAQAQKMADEIGISLSGMIKMLLKNTIKTGKLYIDAKPKYHGRPEKGDVVFTDLDEATKYFKELAENDGIMA